MSDKTPIMLSWSSGKDSAWALQALLADPSVELRGLITTVNAVHDRVAMHAVRVELLKAQAQALGLPLMLVDIPHPCSNEEYQAAWTRAADEIKAKGIQEIAFGDLFLEDIRQYREEHMASLGFRPRFPLWGQDTVELAKAMLGGGLRARLTCVDPKQCPRQFVGREFDQSLLDELPASVDPCGENGEFHTFVYAGPMFQQAIEIEGGEVVERGGFVFADLKLRGGNS